MKNYLHNNITFNPQIALTLAISWCSPNTEIEICEFIKNGFQQVLQIREVSWFISRRFSGYMIWIFGILFPIPGFQLEILISRSWEMNFRKFFWPFYEKAEKPEVDVSDIKKLVGCKMFSIKLLTLKLTQEVLPTAWGLIISNRNIIIIFNYLLL